MWKKPLFLAALLCGMAMFGTAAEPTVFTDVFSGPPSIAFRDSLTSRGALDHLFLVNCFYSGGAITEETTALLNDLQRRYPKQLTVYGVSPESPEALKKWLANHPTQNYRIGSDPELRSPSAKHQAKLVPFTARLFDRSGKLLWSGDPQDAPMMVKRVFDGKYSELDEIRMAELTTALDAALRSGDANAIVLCAGRVLDARPEQLSALKAKLFGLEQQGKTAELRKFLDDWSRHHAEIEEVHLILLNALLRNPDAKAKPTLTTVVENYLKRFPKSPDGQYVMAWALLTRAEFSADALQAARKVAAHWETQSDPAEFTARFEAVRALLASREGHPDQAVRHAEKALRAATAQEREVLSNMLEYYRYVQALPKSAAEEQ